MTTARTIIVDIEQWPLVKVTYLNGITSHDVTSANLTILGLLRRNERFAMITDISKQDKVIQQMVDSAKQAQKMIDSKRADFQRLLACNALIAKPSLWLMPLNAIIAMSDPPFPTKVHIDMKSAELWCNQKLRSSNAA